MNVFKHPQKSANKDTAGAQNQALSRVSLRRESVAKKLVGFLAHLSAKMGLAERRKDERVSARELLVSCAAGLEEKRIKIKDISPTGAYLHTGHRWFVGTKLLLTLQNRSQRQIDAASQVQLVASVVRLEKDGVGVSFIDGNQEAEPWLTCISKATSLNLGGGAVRLFQMAKALAFLVRISPSAEDGILTLFREQLSEDRIDRALNVVLGAERRIGSRNAALKSAIDPSLVLQIIEEGSMSGEEPIRECWVRLLAGSALAESNDYENANYASILSKLEPVHVLLLVASGQKSVQADLESSECKIPGLYCGTDEVKRIARSNNLAVIECALNRLHDLGMLELTIKPFGCAVLQSANLTPTKLGLDFYNACWGRMISPETLDAATRKAAS